MKRSFFCLLVLVLLVPLAADGREPGRFPTGTVMTSVVIDGATTRAVQRLKDDPRLLSWLEVGDRLFLFHRDEEMPVPTFRSPQISRTPFRPEAGPVMLAVRRGSDDPLEAVQDHLTILVRYRAWTVFQAAPAVLERLESERSNHFELTPLPANLRLLFPGERLNRPLRAAASSLPADKKKIGATIQELQDFKTRYTYSPQYRKAAEHMAEAFRALGYQAELREYSDYSGPQYNVVAQAADFTTDKFFLIGAHLDSTSPRPRELAPGADDNGSGSAGVLEVARLLAATPARRQVRFVLFAGEEVGLKGSTAYVKRLQADGEASRLAGVVIFDMIGFDRTPPLSCLFEMKPYCDDFAAPFLATARKHGLKTTVSHHPWGSDHVPFFGIGVPCFLFIEDEFEANHNYHQTTDLLQDVNLDLCAAFCRTVAEVLAER